jgi:hypothetical protein
MSTFMPMVLGKLQAGENLDDVDAADMMEAFTSAPSIDDMSTVILDMDLDQTERRFIVMADPSHLVRSSTLHDLQGEVTLFAVTQRLVPEGQSYSLERFVLPGIPPVLQRAFTQAADLGEMLSQLGPLLGGRHIDVDSINLTGPAIILKPVAFY